MRTLLAAAACAALLATPVVAQTSDRMQRPGQRMTQDAGPTTPDVNAAYMGGGVILEGPPNAPAPQPEPTPPGQRPRHMVEPGTPPAHPLTPLYRNR